MIAAQPISPIKLQLLRDALGLDQHGRGTAYRNHYICYPGKAEYVHLMAMELDGLMRRSTVAHGAGADVFTVTRAGREVVAARGGESVEAFTEPTPNRHKQQVRRSALANVAALVIAVLAVGAVVLISLERLLAPLVSQ